MSFLGNCAKEAPLIIEAPTNMKLLGSDYSLVGRTYLIYPIVTSSRYYVGETEELIDARYVFYDYGDSTPVTKEVTHRYLKSGLYTIRVTVDSSTGRIYHLQKQVQVVPIVSETIYKTNCSGNSSTTFYNLGEPVAFWNNSRLFYNNTTDFYSTVSYESPYWSKTPNRFQAQFYNHWDSVFINHNNGSIFCEGKRQ